MQLHETRHLLAPIAQKCTCYLLSRFRPRPITAFGIELSKHRSATCSAKVNRLSMIALTLESVKRSSYCTLTPPGLGKLRERPGKKLYSVPLCILCVSTLLFRVLA